MEIQFSIIISTTIVHIQLKFDIWMYLINKQVQFEFYFGPVIFDRVVQLEKKFSVFALLLLKGCIHTIFVGYFKRKFRLL